MLTLILSHMHVLPTTVHTHGQQMQEIGLFTCCQQSLDMSVTSKSRTQDFAIFDENWWRRSSWVPYWYDATSIMTNFDYHRWQAHACQRLCPYRTLIWGIVFSLSFHPLPSLLPSPPSHGIFVEPAWLLTRTCFSTWNCIQCLQVFEPLVKF